MATLRLYHPSLSCAMGEIRLEDTNISGNGGSLFPYLATNMEIKLNSCKARYVTGNGPQAKSETFIQDYTLLQLHGSLFVRSQAGGIIGEVSHFQSLPIQLYSRPETSGNINLRIPLNAYQIQQIEDRRVGDVTLKFDLHLVFAKHHLRSQQMEEHAPFEKFESYFHQLEVTIAQSRWIDNVLPGLGYGQRHLVEVPIPQQVFDGSFSAILAEFKDAEKYMAQGDYNKVLGKYRNVLELLSRMKKYDGEKESPSFADKIDFLLISLPGAPNGVRKENLARMLKDAYGLTSIAQHPSPTQFTRDDAEMMQLIIVSLLSYIGKFIVRQEEQ